MNTIKYIGIDVHQATSVFAIRDSRGNILGESILKQSQQQLSIF